MTDWIAEARARLDAATPAPWDTPDDQRICAGTLSTERSLVGEAMSEKDARFIAAAPTDLRRALDTIERVREACLSWEGAAKFMVSDEEAGKINAITNHILDVLDGRGPGGEPEVEW